MASMPSKVVSYLTFFTTPFPVTTALNLYLTSAGELESPVEGGDFRSKCSFCVRQCLMLVHVTFDLFDQ